MPELRPLPTRIPPRGAPAPTHARPHGAEGPPRRGAPRPQRSGKGRLCPGRGVMGGAVPHGAPCPPAIPAPAPGDARAVPLRPPPCPGHCEPLLTPCPAASRSRSVAPPFPPPAHRSLPGLAGSSYFLFKTIIIFTFHFSFFFFLLAMYRLLRSTPTHRGAPRSGPCMARELLLRRCGGRPAWKRGQTQESKQC